MIRVGNQKASRTSEWCDLGRGVRILMRPLVSFEYRAARARAGEILDKYFEGAAELEPFGFPPDALSDASEDEHDYMLIGLTQVMTAVFAAEMVVGAIDGAGDADGVPLPVSRASFGLLFQDSDFLSRFEAHAYKVIFLEADEGE